MDKKEQLVVFGIIFLSLLALTFVYAIVVGSSNDVYDLNMQFVSKTEYIGGDVGQVIVELRNAINNSQVIPATCLANVRYPNKTIFLANQSMVNVSSGSKYINFTVPSTEGTYEYQAVCSYNNKQYIQSSSFHVSSGYRLLQDSVLGRIQIIPQGVSEAKIGETAAESWMLETQRALNITAAYCSVYRLLNNNRSFVAGIVDYYDFNNGIPATINYTNATTASYALIQDSGSPTVGIAPGSVWNQSNKLNFDTTITSSEAWATVPPPNATNTNWEMSMDITGLFNVGGASTFHIALLGVDRDGGGKFSRILTSPYSTTPLNGLIIIGLNDNILADGQGWLDGSSYVAGSGNLFVRRNTTVNGTRWVKTNVSIATSANIKLTRNGDLFSVYSNNVLAYQWVDAVSEIKGVSISSAVPSGTPTSVDNYQLRYSVSDSYTYDNSIVVGGEFNPIFTYYWLPAYNLVKRGSNYVVDCDVALSSATGVSTMQNMIQYVYINSDDRIKAVSIK